MNTQRKKKLIEEKRAQLRSVGSASSTADDSYIWAMLSTIQQQSCYDSGSDHGSSYHSISHDSGSSYSDGGSCGDSGGGGGGGCD